ncbi:MAG: hypothetical protein IKM48_08525 [Clostridia bacterium]|nr:hypothetical protein [Clostridia bacterium]
MLETRQSACYRWAAASTSVSPFGLQWRRYSALSIFSAAPGGKRKNTHLCNIKKFIASRCLLDIFCVAAAANLLPSSATGSGRSRNSRHAASQSLSRLCERLNEPFAFGKKVQIFNQ